MKRIQNGIQFLLLTITLLFICSDIYMIDYW
jgi:hypothetical protein